MSEILYTKGTYQVRLLTESVPIEQSGVTLYFHYDVYNTQTDRAEGYSQFLPNAIDHANMLDQHLSELLPASKEDSSDNVVEFNA